MNAIEDKTVAEVVSENIKTAHIFKKHGIDFCCGGGISIKKACEKQEVDYKLIEEELLNVDADVSRAYDYNNWNLDFLIDHIINVHHTYVEESIPLIIQYSDRVAKVHGHHYTEVVEINRLFKEVAGELAAHLQKEEIILFPYIKKLLAMQKEGVKTTPPPFGSVNNPIQMMETEHEDAGDIFKQIALLSNNYTPPEGACNTFKALYSKLQEFEDDLHRHIHLENNILHPKALDLEASLA
ncbi:iron-sulfur cluster repair di-iron protein [Leptobacterium flavescens]|uniref:Iron-sulfur cluster repair di-iron protein n=1 Tax=Leptobacterium flavescens TaxID=472055 RepID=A0A6P0UM52_9FLAO|nr:iron-sulfur cluster repair di-iron protein [Leptobacterium flavescens]NER13652.1 iron-sulfur cluster repair di-iron protein [Leptobacterium flavescens]